MFPCDSLEVHPYNPNSIERIGRENLVGIKAVQDDFDEWHAQYGNEQSWAQDQFPIEVVLKLGTSGGLETSVDEYNDRFKELAMSVQPYPSRVPNWARGLILAGAHRHYSAKKRQQNYLFANVYHSSQSTIAHFYLGQSNDSHRHRIRLCTLNGSGKSDQPPTKAAICQPIPNAS
jgi:hypothetical protein